MHSVYWIRNASHTDIFSQGYVGVSNNVVKRWNSHKNKPTNYHFSNAVKMYGWDNLVKEVVLLADEDYCLDIETKLRPNDKIGWNVVAGGGLPPSSKGKVLGAMSDETKRKISLAKTGGKGTRNGAVNSSEMREKISKALLGKVAWNKGRKMTAEELDKLRANGFGVKKGVALRKGAKHTEETKAKMSLSKTGKKQSKEHIEKCRLARMGVKQVLIKCNHCDKTGGASPMKRWHFENCKNKGINNVK